MDSESQQADSKTHLQLPNFKELSVEKCEHDEYYVHIFYFNDYNY